MKFGQYIIIAGALGLTSACDGVIYGDTYIPSEHQGTLNCGSGTVTQDLQVGDAVDPVRCGPQTQLLTQ